MAPNKVGQEKGKRKKRRKQRLSCSDSSSVDEEEEDVVSSDSSGMYNGKQKGRLRKKKEKEKEKRRKRKRKEKGKKKMKKKEKGKKKKKKKLDFSEEYLSIPPLRTPNLNRRRKSDPLPIPFGWTHKEAALVRKESLIRKGPTQFCLSFLLYVLREEKKTGIAKKTYTV